MRRSPFVLALLFCLVVPAAAVDRGQVTFTGNFTRTPTFNPFGPSLFGNFGTMTVASGTGIFAGLTGTTLSMSTTALTTGLTAHPLMTWMTINGLTIATSFVSASAGGEPPAVVGTFDISGPGVNVGFQLWSFQSPPIGTTGPITLKLSVFDAVFLVPEGGQTFAFLVIALLTISASKRALSSRFQSRA